VTVICHTHKLAAEWD